MKILIVYNDYRQSSGEQAYVAAEVNLLRQHGHEVVLYTQNNSAVDRYGLWEKALFFPRTVFSVETYRDAQTLVRREKPDVAHVHNVFPLMSPALYRGLHRAGIPMVQTIHNFRLLCPNSRFYTHGQICERCKYGNTLHAVRLKCHHNNRLISAASATSLGLHRQWGTFNLIDRFISPTHFPASKLVESGLVPREKITIIEHFQPDPLPSVGSFDLRMPYVVYLGTLWHEKGVASAIRALDGLPHLSLKIVGNGPEREHLMALAHTLPAARIEFLGHVSGDEKYEILRRATASVVPSIAYETFSLAALESLAVGTPVIASNLGSLPYVVADQETGFLFRPGDAADLRAKLAMLSDNPALIEQFGRTARRMVEQRWTAAQHYERLITTYERVLR